MPIAWYIVPYEIYRDKRIMGKPLRRPAILQYQKQIQDAGGMVKWYEIMGDRCVVKLRASQNIIDQADALYKRLPKNRLDDSLSDLPTGVKQALRDEVLDQGHTINEIRDRFGNDLGKYTLRQVLRFMARKRRKPVYDPESDDYVCSGVEVDNSPDGIDHLDQRVSD